MDDLERCQRWINDPEVHKTLEFRTPMSLKQERDWLEKACCNSFKELTLAICIADDHRHIGVVSLLDSQPTHRKATFGILVGETELHDRGFGTEATRLICQYGFEEMNLHKINLTVRADNLRGIHVYEKVGFVKEGLLKDEIYRQGMYQDMLTMGLFRDNLA